MIGYYVVCVACVPYFYHSIIMNIESVNKQLLNSIKHITFHVQIQIIAYNTLSKTLIRFVSNIIQTPALLTNKRHSNLYSNL